MAQARVLSFLEAAANVVLGLLVALGLQGLLYPALGIRTSLPDNLKIAGLFCLASLLRGYLVRRLFATLARPR